jgi:CRISPR-associated endonuclease/helicase Cas3
MLTLPLTERLAVIEAPTGSGKTEASVIWADRLTAAGLIDGMYFAVPTRSAATELHARIANIMGHAHPNLVGRVVRAVPGLLDTDHPTNVWDEPTIPTWASGSTRRVMGAPIAVGTIDQAMLSQVLTRHAWLRAWCLARQLLVIDEVHASDPYMSEIVTRLIDEHLALGGYALLMSATLGESLRAKLEHRQRVESASAILRPYPQVSTSCAQLAVDITARRTTNLILEEQADASTRALTRQAVGKLFCGFVRPWPMQSRIITRSRTPARPRCCITRAMRISTDSISIKRSLASWDHVDGARALLSSEHRRWSSRWISMPTCW